MLTQRIVEEHGVIELSVIPAAQSHVDPVGEITGGT
jgi:hypothetical protein